MHGIQRRVVEYRQHRPGLHSTGTYHPRLLADGHLHSITATCTNTANLTFYIDIRYGVAGGQINAGNIRR